MLYIINFYNPRLYNVRKLYHIIKQLLNMKHNLLDENDLEILKYLKQDARLSVRKLAKITKIRPSTVHNRIQRMKKDGIIERFTVKLNSEKLGENLTVFMLVSGTMDRYIDDRFLRNEHILEIHGITGEYDLLLKLRFRDMKQFNKFVIDFRDRYSRSISKTITMVQTIELKE